MCLQLLPSQQQLRLLWNKPRSGDFWDRNNELRCELQVLRGQLQRRGLLHVQFEWNCHIHKSKHCALQPTLCEVQFVQCFLVHGLSPRPCPRARLMYTLHRYHLHQLLKQPCHLSFLYDRFYFVSIIVHCLRVQLSRLFGNWSWKL